MSLLLPTTSEQCAPEPSDTLLTARARYLDAILRGDRKTAFAVAMQAVESGLSVPDVYMEILQVAHYEVGRLWENNVISVAGEHIATAVTQGVLSRLYALLPVAAASRGDVVVTGVEGEHHQLGANMVADVIESDGWNVRFLGCQVPEVDIISLVESTRPSVLGISATMGFSVPRVASLIAGVRALSGHELRILVGGGAFRGEPELWREIGADGHGGDLRQALALVRGFFGSAGDDPEIPSISRLKSQQGFPGGLETAR
jgi:MerR family transcriptional regulator, light-induced transcriptional regulator